MCWNAITSVYFNRGYNVAVLSNGVAVPGAGGFVTTNSISLTGLTPDTSYTLQVTSVDAVAGEAPISGSHTVVTCE